MRADEAEQIRRLPLFRDMEEKHFESLLRGAYLRNFPPQIEMITEGEPSDFLHIVVDGSVELFADWDGRRAVMATMHPISTFILAATVRDAPYLMSARTLEKARIILLPSPSVRAVFDADAAFARAVVADLAQSYRGVVKHTKDLKLRNSLERLANYLLRTHLAAGAPARFELSIEKRKLASLLGMTPENLSRAFRTLLAHGVTVTGSTVRVTNVADLTRLARPTPLIDDPEM